MTTRATRKPTRQHKPSPLQPYVDSGAPPRWMFAGHLLETLPRILAGIAVLMALAVGAPYVPSAYTALKMAVTQPRPPTAATTSGTTSSATTLASTP